MDNTPFRAPLVPAVPIAAFLLSVVCVPMLLVACGPKVSPVETAQVRERDPDADVLVYVREDDGIPPCPWEVLGTIEVEEGWRQDDDARDVRRAAAKLGGHAILAETEEDAEVRVVRFFDPLCNPVSDDD